MKRHDLDVVSLVAGLLFAGLALAYGIGAYTDLRLDPRYVFPLVVIGLGLAGLAAAVTAQRRSDAATGSGEVTASGGGSDAG